MFDALKMRLAEIQTLPQKAAEAAAPRIANALRTAATTKRGNVPEPITATASAEEIRVTAPDWVMKKAKERGDSDEWLVIVGDECNRAAGG